MPLDRWTLLTWHSSFCSTSKHCVSCVKTSTTELEKLECSVFFWNWKEKRREERKMSQVWRETPATWDGGENLFAPTTFFTPGKKFLFFVLLLSCWRRRPCNIAAGIFPLVFDGRKTIPFLLSSSFSFFSCSCCLPEAELRPPILQFPSFLTVHLKIDSYKRTYWDVDVLQCDRA